MGLRWHWLLAVGGAIMIGSAGGGSGQEQREIPGELVQPEVREEVPPLIVDPADEPQERQLRQDVEQLLTSLRRAQEALQLDHRATAMQELMQAEEQLDQAEETSGGAEWWQRVNLALQDATKALAEDSPRHALIALQRVTVRRDDVGGSREAAERGGQAGDSVLQTRSASEVIGAEVVNARGETVAQVSDIVRAPDGGGLYAILDVGGFLGIGEKEVALALDQLQVAEDDKLVLPQATEDQLEDMPIYDQDRYERLR